MYYLGRQGSATSNPVMRNMFGIGRGTARTWKKRVMIAIQSLRNEFITWTDAIERKEISQRMHHKYSLLNCVGIADGTLFPLIDEPETEDALAYKGRKHIYSMSVMIVNNDSKKIRCHGSAHDQRVYSWTLLQTPLFLENFNFSDSVPTAK